MPAMATDNVFDSPHLGASSGTFKMGMKSAEVADLQRNLQKLGFIGIRADGVYDRTVSRIVSLIQKAIMRPETGEVDSFTDASITRALDASNSMEALRIGIAAREWSQTANSALVAAPQTVQMIGEETSVFKNPMFWLAAAGLVTGVLILFKKTETPLQPTLMGADDSAVDDPDEFFDGMDKPKRKRKKARKAKQALAGSDADEDEGDIVDAEATEVTDGEPTPEDQPALPARGEAGQFLPRGAPLKDTLADFKPKRRKPKRRKSKALAETTPAPADEIVGEPGDPDTAD